MNGMSVLLGSSEYARRRFLRPYSTTAITAAIDMRARTEATITSVNGEEAVPATPSSPVLLSLPPALDPVGRLLTGLSVLFPDADPLSLSLPDEPPDEESTEFGAVSLTGMMRISSCDPEPW